MKGEAVLNIYKPENGSEWVLIETDKALYSLQLGGFKKEMNAEILNNHTELPFPYKGKFVQEIFTDEEWVYILLGEGGVIASGWVDVNFRGDLELGVIFNDITEYEPNFFQSALFSKLIVGADSWSKAI